MAPTDAVPRGTSVELSALNEALSEVWGSWPFTLTAADKADVTERTLQSFLRAFDMGERDPAVLKRAALAPFRLLQLDRDVRAKRQDSAYLAHAPLAKSHHQGAGSNT